jgi:hypothetical protein
MSTVFPTGFNKQIAKMNTADIHTFGIDLGRFIASVNSNLSSDEVKSVIEMFLQTVNAGSVFQEEEVKKTFVERVGYGYHFELNL